MSSLEPLARLKQFPMVAKHLTTRRRERLYDY